MSDRRVDRLGPVAAPLALERVMHNQQPGVPAYGSSLNRVSPTPAGQNRDCLREKAPLGDGLLERGLRRDVLDNGPQLVAGCMLYQVSLQHTHDAEHEGTVFRVDHRKKKLPGRARR